MNGMSFSSHCEIYEINGKKYKAIANFISNQLYIKGDDCNLQFNLEEYVRFDGNMEDFVKANV